MENRYNPAEIEPKWQKYWEESPDLCQASEESSGEKAYILDMFPYPSGEGLHMGHVESYTATDIYSRYLRMKGKNVLHPQGFDAFGLPAENYAVKSGVHPSITTQKAITNFTRQMGTLGFSYDWSRLVDTSRQDYYRWTQWFFLLLYKNGLAYRKKAKANWCPKCQTVLANEQVEGGKCERCETEVVQKDLEQWFFKITEFLEDSENTSGLISGLEKVDWPESTKAGQRNWIGKSEGTTIKFLIKLQNQDDRRYLEVFTTRVDTIFGCTYCVVAPEHEILKQVQDDIENWNEVEEYIQQAKKKTDLDRMEAKEKTGVELKGIKVVNPFNNEEVPLFVADYVLGHYGTGAVMAVPAHDERDFEFAKRYDLPIKAVIGGYVEFWDKKTEEDGIYLGSKMTRRTFNPKNFDSKLDDALVLVHIDQINEYIKERAFIDDGWVLNSEDYSGYRSDYVREKMAAWLEENNLGQRKVNYKIRDWLVSRQRYWGAPIPIIYCDNCGEVPVPENELPVVLPDDVDFKPTGESPLNYSQSFQDVTCPKCGAKARRESDTMDTFVCSSWYYFRYADPKNEKEFASREKLDKWLPVDLYVGGAEHTVLHLLYSRFFTKVLHKLGYIGFDEPFQKLRHQGIILAEDGSKMSKSKGNVINPDDIIKEYGADALRMFEMFMGPLEDMKPWNTRGIVGIVRFLERVYKLNEKRKTENENPQLKTQSLMQKSIKKISEDIEVLKLNTAISQLMILLNALEDEEELRVTDYELLITLLAPFAPHLSEELWSRLGHAESIFKEKWPDPDPEFLKDEEVEIIIQVNGKLRDRISVPADMAEEDVKKMALEREKINSFINGKEVRKMIIVPQRLVNIVV